MKRNLGVEFMALAVFAVLGGLIRAVVWTGRVLLAAQEGIAHFFLHGKGRV